LITVDDVIKRLNNYSVVIGNLYAQKDDYLVSLNTITDYFDFDWDSPTRVDVMFTEWWWVVLFSIVISSLLVYLTIKDFVLHFNNVGKVGPALDRFEFADEENADEFVLDNQVLIESDFDDMNLFEKANYKDKLRKYSNILDNLNEIDPARQLKDHKVKYNYVVRHEWYHIRRILLLCFITTACLIVCAWSTKYYAEDDYVSVLGKWLGNTNDKARYSVVSVFRVWSKSYFSVLGKNKFYDILSWSGTADYTMFVYGYELLEIIDSWLYPIMVCNLFEIMMLLISWLFLGFVLFFLLGEIAVSIDVDVDNTPLPRDLRPDDMKKLAIRHNDAKLSEVTETPNLLYCISRFYQNPIVQRYVVSFELMSQLASPSHFVYGMTEEDIVHKMAHTAGVTCQINIDRHDYTRTNCFENTVRLAKYAYLSRDIRGLANF